LLERAQLLRTLLREKGVDIGKSESQIIPVIFGANERATSAAERLQAEGFDVRAIRPPAVPPGTARLRVSVNAELDECTIRKFADGISGCRGGL
jgi:8-amino-7-oxononanoate synthase